MGVGIREKVMAYIEKNRMIEDGDNIVVGVSGGADSVCLLIVLAELEKPLSLTAVHINHGIREEAGEDEAFVGKLCQTLGVPCRVFHENVEQLAAKEHLSTEEAGRMVRYRAFSKVLEEVGGGKIAVAHNENDRAETLLFHMIRGSGLNGMAAIRPVRDNVIRPILCLSRAEIEAFLRERGQGFCIDRTNAENTYTRNKIRNQILPYAEREICSRATGHLAEEAALLEETADFVNRQTKAALKRCMEASQEIRFSVSAYRMEDPLLQGTMIQECLNGLCGGRDLSRKDVEAVKYLFSEKCQSGRKVSVVHNRARARREFDAVILTPMEKKDAAGGNVSGAGSRSGAESAVWPEAAAQPESAAPAGCRIPVPAEAERMLWETGLDVPGLGNVRIRYFAYDEKAKEEAGKRRIFENIEENKYTKWFDYDKITEYAEFRVREKDDYLTVNEALQKKRLKAYLTQEKVPAEQRESLIVLADGNHIMWVPGYRVSAAYKITENTRIILEICVRGGKVDD